MMFLNIQINTQMQKNKKYFNIIVVVLAGVLIFNIVFPSYINRGLSLVSSKIPHIPQKSFKLGLDLVGGSHLVYEADLSKIQEAEKKEAMAGLRDVIERRVNIFGVAEPQVQVQEAGESFRLVVDLPGVKDVKEAINQIGKTPYLEFKKQRPDQETKDILAKLEGFQGTTDDQLTSEQKIEKMKLELQDPFFEPTSLTGRFLQKADLGFNQTSMEAMVLIEFNQEGADLFKTLTEENVGKRIAIYIDNNLISAPTVNEAIPSGKAQITGSFTIDQAKELARNLNAGALPVPIELISQDTVGPTLGQVSLQKSLRAALFGSFAVVLFMIVFYRLSGFLASVSLVFYAIILLALFKFVPITLTLAGIGGAILSVGMAVDANVLIFERFKEERKAGQSFAKSVDEGVKRAWPSIRDSNLTTLLIALIMFSFGTSFVKGFALTLSLGILTSMLTSMVITRVSMQVFQGTKLEKVAWLWK